MNVGIIGGGAAGLFAAVNAARQHMDVTLFEHMPRVGKKLLLTGSGKCNISNLDMDKSHFHCDNKALIDAIINENTVRATYDLFHSIGVAFKDRNGYLYPYCEQSSAVVDALRYAADEAGVMTITDCEVTGIERCKDGRFCPVFNDPSVPNDFLFDRMILAAGSCAAAKSGSDGSGYKLAKKLGHHIIAPYPALTYLKCDSKEILPLANIRTQARICLMIDGSFTASECGELQLTKNGLSGIPVFQLSYLASRAISENRKVSVNVNFLPEVCYFGRIEEAFNIAKLMMGEPSEKVLDEGKSHDAVIKMLTSRCGSMPKRPAVEILTGLLHKSIVSYVLKKAGVSPIKAASSLDAKEISDIAKLLISLKFDIIGTGSFDEAQICGGGVDTFEIGCNMESKLIPGLYFAGEIADVNGDCGGYNLQWAWSSAYIASMA